MLVLGIDFGKQGGYCFLNDQAQIIEIGSLPINKATDSLDVIKFSEILSNYLDQDIRATGEALAAIFGVSAASTFGFGFEIAKVKAVLEMFNIPLSEVKPLLWQTHIFNLAGTEQIYKAEKTKTGKQKRDTKAMAYEATATLFPDLDPRYLQKNKDGVRDALLIALYSLEITQEKI